MKTLILIISLISTYIYADSGVIYNDKVFGDYYYSQKGIRNAKALIVCFHGSGGKGSNWKRKDENKNFLESLNQNGYIYLCPTSKNRNTKKWDNKNNKNNQDVVNVDKLIKHLNLQNKKIVLVGHSNGGGFVSRYALLSQYSKNISAVQYSNSSGLLPAMEKRKYTFPTMFAYASCDFVPESKINTNANYLKRKNGRKSVELVSLDFRYRLKRSRNCHEFLDTSKESSKFFNQWINTGRPAK